MRVHAGSVQNSYVTGLVRIVVVRTTKGMKLRSSFSSACAHFVRSNQKYCDAAVVRWELSNSMFPKLSVSCFQDFFAGAKEEGNSYWYNVSAFPPYPQKSRGPG